MKTLDEDAEILKRRAESSTSGSSSPASGSGRKVGQAGLGAFKILNKYSNLTSKYRDPEKTKENVPHNNRGTIPAENNAKSVQSQGEVSASVARTSKATGELLSVQSQGKVSANASINIDSSLDSKSVQNSDVASEVGANGIEEKVNPSESPVNELPTLHLSSSNNIPQAQIESALSGCKVGADEVFADHSDSATTEPVVIEGKEFSAEVRARPAPTSNPTTAAKSVQSQGEVGAHKNLTAPTSAIAKSVQSGGKVSAPMRADAQEDQHSKSVQTQCAVADLATNTKPDESPVRVEQVSAKSVHSDLEPLTQTQQIQKTKKALQIENEKSQILSAAESVSPQQSQLGHQRSENERTAKANDDRNKSRFDVTSANSENNRPEPVATKALLNEGKAHGKTFSQPESVQIIGPTVATDSTLAAAQSPQKESPIFSDASEPGNDTGLKTHPEQDYVTNKLIINDPLENSELVENANKFVNSVQTPGKVSANQVQSRFTVGANVGAKSVQTPGEVGSIVSANQDKKIHLISSELHPLESVTSLTGTQRVIVEFLYDQCVFNNSLVTPPISKQQLLSSTSLNEETALSSIKRLRKKLIIDREAYKDGKAGWTQYRLSDVSYKELLNFRQSHAKSVQTPGEVGSKVSSKVGANLSSKIDSNFKLNNSLTTDDLDEIDFSLTGSFGITKSIVADIRKNNWKISRSQIEAHVERFATWAANPSNARGIKNLRGLFCSNLKQISESGMDPFDFIKTESEQLMDQMLLKRREYLDELKKKQSALFEVEFETWLLETPRLQLENLVPISNLAPIGSEIRLQSLKAYFAENVYSG